MSRNFRLILPLLLVSLASAQPAVREQPQRYLEDVKFLASDAMEGRGAGTKGLDQAAKYIEDRFKALGLQPAGDNGTYRQSLQVTTGARPGSGNQLEVTADKQASSLRLNSDYRPLSFSSNGEVNGPVVFGGYGVTAPEFHYDDYGHIDVKDKIVVVLRYEPESFHKGRESKERAWTHHATLVSKAINARNHGAKGLILVNGDAGKDKDTLIRFGSVAGPEDAGIYIAQVTNEVANGWLKHAQKDLSAVQKEIGDKSAAVSFPFPEDFRVKLRVDVQRDKAMVYNVAGFLPGRTNEYIIIGAHYDHLGLGNENSLAPSQIGKVHHGADDNASGTAGILELARLLGGEKKDLTRGVLFLAFSGEEIGLLGSAHWANHPTRSLDSAVAMINLDMIGRIKGSKLYIGGTGTGSTFEPLLKEIGSKYKFQIEKSADGYSSSDHTSFVAKSVPVLFFFSGLHGDYHKPSDTWDKIDVSASVQVVNMVHDVAFRLAGEGERPKFVKVQSNPHGGAVPSGGGGGYGPYFGSIPDFAEVPKGVKFSDVRPGSPADKAGLKGGDILIGFGDKPINNLYDFTYALRGSKVGDVVVVKYLRDGKEMTAKVTLEPRP